MHHQTFDPFEDYLSRPPIINGLLKFRRKRKTNPQKGQKLSIHSEQEKPNQFTDLDDCLTKIREILATPIPKRLFIFDDDEDIDLIRGELLLECLSLARKCADARGHPLGD